MSNYQSHFSAPPQYSTKRSHLLPELLPYDEEDPEVLKARILRRLLPLDSSYIPNEVTHNSDQIDPHPRKPSKSRNPSSKRDIQPKLDSHRSSKKEGPRWQQKRTKKNKKRTHQSGDAIESSEEVSVMIDPRESIAKQPNTDQSTIDSDHSRPRHRRTGMDARQKRGIRTVHHHHQPLPDKWEQQSMISMNSSSGSKITTDHTKEYSAEQCHLNLDQMRDVMFGFRMQYCSHFLDHGRCDRSDKDCWYAHSDQLWREPRTVFLDESLPICRLGRGNRRECPYFNHERNDTSQCNGYHSLMEVSMSRVCYKQHSCREYSENGHCQNGVLCSNAHSREEAEYALMIEEPAYWPIEEPEWYSRMMDANLKKHSKSAMKYDDSSNDHKPTLSVKSVRSSSDPLLSEESALLLTEVEISRSVISSPTTTTMSEKSSRKRRSKKSSKKKHDSKGKKRSERSKSRRRRHSESKINRSSESESNHSRRSSKKKRKSSLSKHRKMSKSREYDDGLEQMFGEECSIVEILDYVPESIQQYFRMDPH